MTLRRIDLMTQGFKLIGNTMLETESTYRRPEQKFSTGITLSSPAVSVMTDLSKVAAITVNPCVTIKQAENRMKSGGVRMLLVTNQYHHVIGIITSRDLTGEKATSYLHNVGGKHNEILVQDLMQPQYRVEVLSLDHVYEAKVGNIVETLKSLGRRHALVVDRDENGKMVVCGVFSVTQIAKQLGLEIDVDDVPGSIAALSAAKK